MGQGSAVLPSVHCCQEERSSQRWRSELLDGEVDVAAERSHAWDDGSLVRLEHDSVWPVVAVPCVPVSGGCQPAPRLRCCEGPLDAEAGAAVAASAQPLESLSYTPLRFDEGPTVDVERSHARYSKIILHSARARTQKRSKAWGDWLSAATAGRAVTLLTGLAEAPEGLATATAPGRVPAMYHLDRSLAKLSILPANEAERPPLTIPVDSIQVICPATDFVLLVDQVDAKLSELEKSRAVLLQYTTEDTQRRRTCFLEESEAAREDFVQALTALWLERRNDHSMWF